MAYGKDRGKRWKLAAIFFLLGFVTAAIVFNFYNMPTPTPIGPEPPKEALRTIRVLAVMGGEVPKGVATSATAEVRAGKGRVLINTNPFVEPDTQFSAETAVKIVQALANVSLNDRDVIFTFGNESNLVGGPSAGAAMTLAVLAAIENKTIRKDVAITGTIEEDGSIGLIGGVLEKAEAVANDGATIFIVPKGLETLTYYEQKVQQQDMGGFILERTWYEPRQLDLNNYTMMQWNMTTRGINRIDEAAAIALQ